MMTRAAASLGTNVITLDQALETPPWKSTASGMNELLCCLRGDGEAMRKAHAKRVATVVDGCYGGAKRHDSQGGVAYRGSVFATVARDLGASLGTELPGYGSTDEG